jgi:signal transduction histidine kinase
MAERSARYQGLLEISWKIGAQRISGYKAEDIIGRHFSIFWRSHQRKARQRAEDSSVRRDGSKWKLACPPEWLTILGARGDHGVRDTTGDLTGFSKVVRDLTDNKIAEELLQEQNHRVQEASRLKSRFLANMSHELRTPLNGIIGVAELMYDGRVGPVTLEHREYLSDILSSANQLLQLINDILDLSNIEAGKMDFVPERTDPAVVVEEMRGDSSDPCR